MARAHHTVKYLIFSTGGIFLAPYIHTRFRSVFLYVSFFPPDSMYSQCQESESIRWTIRSRARPHVTNNNVWTLGPTGDPADRNVRGLSPLPHATGTACEGRCRLPPLKLWILYYDGTDHLIISNQYFHSHSWRKRNVSGGIRTEDIVCCLL